VSQVQPKSVLNLNLTEISSNINGSKTYMISCSYMGRQVALDTFLLPERPRSLHATIEPAMKVKLTTWKPAIWRCEGQRLSLVEDTTSILLEPQNGVKSTSHSTLSTKVSYGIPKKLHSSIDHQQAESIHLGLKQNTAGKTLSTSKRNGKASGSKKA